MTARRVAAGVGVLLALLLLACSSGGDTGGGRAPATSTTSGASVPPTPVGEWETVPPASVGLDATKLAELARVAEAGKSNCLVVVRDGKLVGEWYFRGTDAATEQDVFSATKSLTSTLVGLAVDAGRVRLTDLASRWIPEWAGTPSAAVTVGDLLGNDSGRDWSLAQDYVALLGARDRTAFAVGLGQAAPPGEVWAYNNSAIQTLERVVAGTLGADVPAVARQRLLDPLGMHHSRMVTDPSGHAQMFTGLRSTCRDMARFGSLFLAGGRWNGRRILSRDWVAAATGAPSTDLNAAYGLLWWLNRPGRIAGPLAAVSLAGAADQAPAEGQLAPGAPADMFWALGLGNQLVQVDPGTRTVVVRLGTAERRPAPPTFGVAEAARVVTEAVTGDTEK